MSETTAPEKISCDSCGADIAKGALHWTDAAGGALCEECIKQIKAGVPPVRIGDVH